MANIDIKDLVGKLVANEKVVGLVKMMKPTDIVAVISVDLDLHKDTATDVVSTLLQHVSHTENYINNLGQMNPDINADVFPPKPRSEPAEWPFDDMTKAAMDIKNKGRKRPLMQGPFDPNLKKRQQGGDYGGSQGIYSKNSPHTDNPHSSSGRSYDRKGKPGWSSSPPGKEFDLPDEINGPSPIGASVPIFRGGHSEPRSNGQRVGPRRK